MTIDEFNLVEKFSDEALKQAYNTKPISFAQREDLTAIPLITIDGVDAKDFDDAVFAEPTAGNGWRVIIAIADVSHYVHEDTALDAEAKKEGIQSIFQAECSRCYLKNYLMTYVLLNQMKKELA